MTRKIIFLILIIFIFYAPLFADDSKGWNTEKSTHFIVYYKNAPSDFIRILVNESEDYYNQIADSLGFRRFNFWLWDNRAKIYIYDTIKDYQAATGQPSWSGGCATTKLKIIQSFPYAKGFAETVLPHELGHIIFREFVGFDNYTIPLWLDEGVASFQEKSRYALSAGIVKRALMNNKFIALEKLNSLNMDALQDPETALIFYAEALSLVNYLIKNFGNDDFVVFCQNLRDKKDFQRAMASSYPYSNIEALGQAWQKKLESN